MRTPDHHSRRFAASLTAAAFLSTTSAVFAQSAPWQLIWSDEFDGQFLNLNIWEPQIGTGTLYGLPSGWGNNERQYYTDRSQNLSVGGGWLTITARREDFNGSEYTSARIRTRGRFEFLYGRVEARITIPSGQGIWPAFWMLPTNSPYGGWAASGEIDIMESTNNADQIYGTIHHGGPYPGNRSNGGTYAPGIDFGAAPHLYAVEWDPDQIRWYVDGVQYYSVNSSTWSSTNAPDNERAPFDVPFHFLLNVAVGGNFPGPPNGSVGFPMQMQVDYVRVFRRQQLPYEPSPALIPGQIEAERFDLGGPAVAYNDVDLPNNGGQFRLGESVDIELSSEGSFNVGWIRQGEWLEYTTNVAVAGHYSVESRVAAATAGGTFHLEFNGVDRTGPIVTGVTGGWQTWATRTVQAAIPVGEQVMRFVNDSGSSSQFNLNWFRFTLLAEAGDVNADQSLDLEDLYTLEQGNGAFRDVDLDGVAGTANDARALRTILRVPEPEF